MTAYTVILLTESEPPPGGAYTDNETFTFTYEQESAASPAAAYAAALSAYQAAWLAQSSDANLTSHDVPVPHAYIVLNGTVTIAASAQVAVPEQTGGSDGGRF